jgi:hypothetical protein
MMTRQARSSAVIMGFDTHMISGVVPVLLPEHRNGHDGINRTSRHYAGALPNTWHCMAPVAQVTADDRRAALLSHQPRPDARK